MQRTVFDQTYTPGQAAKNLPGLVDAYPSKTHEIIQVPTRDGNRRRVRIVIQLKKKRR